MICRHHLTSVYAFARRAADHPNHVTAAVQLPNSQKVSEGITT